MSMHTFYKILLLGGFFFCLSANLKADDDIIDEGYFLIMIQDCDGVGDLCLDIPLGESQFYTLTVNGDPYQGMVGGCNNDTTFAYSYANLIGGGNLGPYNLDSWEVNGMLYTSEFQNMAELVELMNMWDLEGNWVLDPISQLIVGGNSSSTYSTINVTTILFNTPHTIGFTLGLEPRGSLYSFVEGVHTVTITNSLDGCMDEFEVEVICVEQAFVEYTIEEGLMGTHCFDFSDLPGNLQTMTNITSPDPEPVAAYAFVNGNTCLEFEGLAVGQDTICIVFCDDLNYCDTTKVSVTVTPALVNRIQETIEIQVYEEDTYCFNMDDITGTINVMNISCYGDEENVMFDFIDNSTYCLELRGLKIGSDKICYRFEDDEGNIVESTLNVNVLAPEPEIIEVNMVIGEIYTDCFDVSEIEGAPVEIYNNCPQNSGNSVFFSINDLSLCIEAQGIAEGFENICIVFCDEKGVCDNVEYRITVIDDGSTSPPIATNDQINISYNESVTLDICENDIWNSEDLTEFNLLSIQEGGNGPFNGSISSNADCQITYQPNDDFCGEDSFTYIICNENGCDGAEVIIQISCPPEEPEEFRVYDGFSPNDDGFNDTFKITGLENYPGSVLNVYNRWGHVVFHKVDYRGDWNGIWNSRALPEGTYFYNIELKPGINETGYVQINR